MSAARKSEAAAAPPPGLLPLPEPAIRHHLETLGKSMRQWLEQKRVPPVLLLTGAEGVGKRATCHYLAQWLLCERVGWAGPAPEAELGLFGEAPPAPAESAPGGAAGEPALSPCGECASCQRAIKGNWVDFQEIATDPEDRDSGMLKIDQFRSLKATHGFGAFEGAFRITLIRDADRMTVQAANSLLKLLEEPPRGWVFLLTAADACLLLPTLVSRCQVIRLKPFSVAELRELLRLEGAQDARIEPCAELAQGSWGKAVKLASDESWERREEIFKFLESPQTEANALIEWAATEPENLKTLLTQLEQSVSELVRWSVEPRHSFSHPSLKSHAAAALRKHGSPARARDFWLARAERLFQVRQESNAPLNRKLLLQDLLLPWIESR